jgi:hypothetical protein
MMKADTHYQRNIKALKRYFPFLYQELRKHNLPDLAFTDIRSITGHPSLEISKGDIRLVLHSRIDPVKEAERFVGARIDGREDVIVLVGFGLGYHVDEILKINRDSNIFVIEPDAGIFQKALHCRDIAHIFSSRRLFFSLTSDTAVFEVIMGSVPASKIKLIVLRPYEQLCPGEVSRIKDDYFSFINRKQINAATLKRFDRLWTKNTFKNSPYFFTLPGVGELKNMFKGEPAIVICAGPSLEDDMPALRQLSDKVFLVAVDTVLQPLLKRGIRPDVAVTVDPQYLSIFFTSEVESLIGNIDDYPLLIADPAIYPLTLRNYGGVKCICSSVFSPGRIIERYSGHKGSMAAGGSVAIAAFDVARMMGADPIIMLGLDLSYTKDKTHLSGSFYEKFILSKLNRFDTFHNYYARYIRSGRPTAVMDKTGKRVLTDGRLLLYREWFENQAPGGEKCKYNATKGGIDIPGFQNISLNEISETLFSRELDKRKIKDQIKKRLTQKTVDRNRVACFLSYLSSVRENLKDIEELCSRAKVLCERILASEEGPEIADELNKIDERFLDFKEENSLLSMVLQTSIDQVMSREEEQQGENAVLSSIELYSSIVDGAKFLRTVLQSARKKLNVFLDNDDNESEIIL